MVWNASRCSSAPSASTHTRSCLTVLLFRFSHACVEPPGAAIAAPAGTSAKAAMVAVAIIAVRARLESSDDLIVSLSFGTPLSGYTLWESLGGRSRLNSPPFRGQVTSPGRQTTL